LKQNLDEGLKSLEGNRVAATRQGRNSARGVNTMRALDLAAYEGANKGESNLYANYANEMTSQLAREAQAEDAQDRVVMGGEGARDLADRQDKDAFASAVSEGLRNLGMTVANAGKQLNEAKTRDTMYDLLETSQFGFSKSTNAIIGKAVKAGNIDTSKYPTKDSLITDLFNKGLLPQYKTLEEALKIK
jgi:predicted lysophospholipase L1 biosynthesis ABC-type transport system permease subunit